MIVVRRRRSRLASVGSRSGRSDRGDPLEQPREPPRLRAAAALAIRLVVRGRRPGATLSALDGDRIRSRCGLIVGRFHGTTAQLEETYLAAS